MSNNQSDVTVIIYGRTYRQDFRMLFQPKNFTREDREWAENYIFSSLRKPEALSSTIYRWSAFKNHHYQIFGISCLASSISTQTLQIPAKHENRAGLAPGRMTHDIENRPVQVFVGFVTNVMNQSIPCRNPNLYGQIYDKYVSNRWWDDTSNWRRTGISESEIIPGCFEEEATQLPNLTDDLQKIFQKLKQKQSLTKSILVIPNLENQAQPIWEWFFMEQFCNSLCIGIPRETINSKIYGKTKFDCVVTDGSENQFSIYFEQSTEDNKEQKVQTVRDPGSDRGSRGTEDLHKKNPELQSDRQQRTKRKDASQYQKEPRQDQAELDNPLEALKGIVEGGLKEGFKFLHNFVPRTDKSRDSSSSDPKGMDHVDQEEQQSSSSSSKNPNPEYWERIHKEISQKNSPDEEAGRED